MITVHVSKYEKLPQSIKHNVQLLEKKMPLSDNQKNRFLVNFRVPAIIFLLWAVLPAQLYVHLFYLVHTVFLIALLPLTIYLGLALREQGKRGLSILAIANSIVILAAIVLINHLDERLMRATF